MQTMGERVYQGEELCDKRGEIMGKMDKKIASLDDAEKSRKKYFGFISAGFIVLAVKQIWNFFTGKS